MSGNGELRHGGSVYVGEFKQGMREGKGTVDYGVQAWFYEGDFKNDQPSEFDCRGNVKHISVYIRSRRLWLDEVWGRPMVCRGSQERRT